MTSVATEIDALVVGAGMGGILALRKLTAEAALDARLVEKGSGIGGTWFWNRYPGALSDTHSELYKLPGDRELYSASTWRSRYATAPEIRAHLEEAVDLWGLRERILFDTVVVSAIFDESSGIWNVETSRGSYRARFLVTALGVLSALNVPDFAGVERFQGRIVHTAAYPEELDLTGMRVGVIGNGSTGVQFMTTIADRVGHLTSFQRTPQYSVPARNRAYTDDEVAMFEASIEEMWARARTSKVGFGLDEVERSAFSVSEEEREAIFQEVWDRGGNMAFLYETFSDLATDRAANNAAADFIKRKIAEIVRDPDTARKLTPTEPYARRPICDHGYYEIFNQSNVSLVSLRETPIRELTETGIVTEDGTLHEVDLIVLATGFDAVDGNYRRMDIRGVGGVALNDHWADGPRSRFGISVAGFPNLFMVLGPNGPFVNLPIAIGAETDWITSAVRALSARPGGQMDLRPEAEEAWMQTCRDAVEGSLFLETGGWIFGANIPGKRQVNTLNFYTGGLRDYVQMTEAEAAAGFPSYEITVPSAVTGTA